MKDVAKMFRTLFMTEAASLRSSITYQKYQIITVLTGLLCCRQSASLSLPHSFHKNLFVLTMANSFRSLASACLVALFLNFLLCAAYFSANCKLHGCS